MWSVLGGHVMGFQMLLLLVFVTTDNRMQRIDSEITRHDLFRYVTPPLFPSCRGHLPSETSPRANEVQII